MLDNSNNIHKDISEDSLESISSPPFSPRNENGDVNTPVTIMPSSSNLESEIEPTPKDEDERNPSSPLEH